MPTYRFHLENSVGPDGNVSDRELPDDERAIKEACAAAGEVLLTELSEGQAQPRAFVTVSRDGIDLAIVRANATVERLVG